MKMKMMMNYLLLTVLATPTVKIRLKSERVHATLPNYIVFPFLPCMHLTD